MNIKVEFKGMEDAVKLLNNMTGGKFDKYADYTANRILYIWERGGKQFAPVDTGTLRRSIFTNHGGFYKGFVSTNTSYAMIVHKRSSSPRYMARAVEEGRPAVKRELEKLVDKLLGKRT